VIEFMKIGKTAKPRIFSVSEEVSMVMKVRCSILVASDSLPLSSIFDL